MRMLLFLSRFALGIGQLAATAMLACLLFALLVALLLALAWPWLLDSNMR